VKLLLTLVLVLGSVCFASVCFASGPQAGESGQAQPKVEQPVNPHLDIPHDCKKTIEADGSVLLTCQCEDCGQPDETDGQNPVPWVCKPADDGLDCNYNIDPQQSFQRGKHSQI
jgi:hypothetical protein